MSERYRRRPNNSPVVRVPTAVGCRRRQRSELWSAWKRDDVLGLTGAPNLKPPAFMSAPDHASHKFSTVSFPASWVAVTHTTLASLAFLTALAVGTGLHYKKIVKNGIAGYPQEWFPSVSATYDPLVPPLILSLTRIASD